MTLLMLAADTAIYSSSPMLGEFPGTPGWKMKNEESDEEEETGFTRERHRSDSFGLDHLLAPFSDVDVAEMASYLDIERCDLGLIAGDSPWLDDDTEDISSYDYLCDTILDLQNDDVQDEEDTVSSLSLIRPALRDHLYSVVSADHMYSVSSGMASRAASTSGYSSGSESLASNEENSVSLLSLAQQAKSLLKKAPSVEREDACRSCPTTNSSPSSSRRPRKRGKDRINPISRNKKWSRMELEEQQDSIMELTNIISSQLGVRERLEAIRIINPHSTVSPTDGEVVIDMKPINDTRFTKLQKFVNLHADDLTSSSTSTAEQEPVQHQQSNGLATEAASHFSNGTAGKASRKRKGRGGRQKVSVSQQMSREEQQRVKEIQSGLFVNEVRVSVQHLPVIVDDDDDNIDILD